MNIDFYNSKAWKQNRRAYALYRNCICERCGRPVYVSGINNTIPKEKRLRYIVHHKTYLDEKNVLDDSIAFDWNNLELLCIECHNLEHHEQPTKKDVMFDAEGNLIQRTSVKRGG